MSNYIQIRYKQIWANLYMLTGLFCSVIFISGAVFLNNNELYIYTIAAVVPIYIGYTMRKSNYALVSNTHIQVFGLFGQLKKEYKLNKTQKFVLKNNRIYMVLNKASRKLKINNWFVNQQDWQRAIELFDTNQSKKITKHLIDD